jgi:hypothetical protein
MSENLVPLFAFFTAFFIAFSLLELMIIWILNKLEKKYWVFVIDRLIRAKVHYGKAIGLAAAAGMALVIFIILLATPFFGIFSAATPIIKNFSLILLLVMIVIYFTTTRKMSRMALEKRVHGYIYFMVSLVMYAFIIIMADQSYNSYKSYMNTTFTEPVVSNVESALDKNEEERLHQQFRDYYLSGKCEDIDYTSMKGGGLINFVFVAEDADLAQNAPLPDGSALVLKGKKCTDGENTFLLTEQGRWYWVIAG